MRYVLAVMSIYDKDGKMPCTDASLVVTEGGLLLHHVDLPAAYQMAKEWTTPLSLYRSIMSDLDDAGYIWCGSEPLIQHRRGTMYHTLWRFVHKYPDIQTLVREYKIEHYSESVWLDRLSDIPLPSRLEVPPMYPPMEATDAGELIRTSGCSLGEVGCLEDMVKRYYRLAGEAYAAKQDEKAKWYRELADKTNEEAKASREKYNTGMRLRYQEAMAVLDSYDSKTY